MPNPIQTVKERWTYTQDNGTISLTDATGYCHITLFFDKKNRLRSKSTSQHGQDLKLVK